MPSDAMFQDDDTRFHNQNAAQLGQMVFEAQERLRLAQEDFATCKLHLIGIAKGAKMEIVVPQFGRIMVIPPKLNEKRRYSVDTAKFEKLDFATQQLLLDDAVVLEVKKSEEPPLPVVRIMPRP